jgi:hypothetical protein
MKNTLSISEQVMYSTVRIECQLKDGSISTGTGFFFRFLDDKENNTHIPVIITNKHVVKDAVMGGFHLTLSDTNGNPDNENHAVFNLDNFESRWIGHPELDIDLCIMPIAPLLEQAKQQNKNLFYIPFGKELIPTKEQLSELTALEDILMIGYPNGIWDAKNNLPILRKGVTATHPNFDYNGQKLFLIDAAVYNGSSGSPILLFNQGMYAPKNGRLVAGDRIMLLGIVFQVALHTALGEIKIISIPTKQQAVPILGVPNNLGIVIKSSKLLDFEPILEQLTKK